MLVDFRFKCSVSKQNAVFIVLTNIPFVNCVDCYLMGYLQEAFNNDNGRAPHSAWRNYDDFNEYFW